MTRRGGVSQSLLVGFLVGCIFVVSGCQGWAPVVTEKETQTASNLSVLHQAYVQFCNKNQRPPANEEELKPFIAEDQRSSAFVSSRDNKPYVIYWSSPLDFKNMESPEIIAHEQDGVSGTRFAFHTFGLIEMSQTDFKTRGLPRSYGS